MNKAEKSTIKAHLNAEQKALQDLEKAYKQAKKDCQERIKALNARTDMQNLQTIIHQKKYQQILLKQIDGVLNDLQTHTFKSANEFFQSAYENGYIGSMYELINQDIPLTIPISRKKMMTAIQTDSKISKDYYMKQGLSVQNIRTLKQQIAQEATRGIATGQSWLEVANLRKGLEDMRSDDIEIAAAGAKTVSELEQKLNSREGQQKVIEKDGREK